MRFASATQVPIEQTRREIEILVTQYGGSAFGSYWRQDMSVIVFEINNRRLRFMLPKPDRNSVEFTHLPLRRGEPTRKERGESAATRAWEQACRQRWRALLLVIKAKMEAVDCKISTFDDEFMSNIVTSNGLTLGERILPQLPICGDIDKLPPLLPSPTQART